MRCGQVPVIGVTGVSYEEVSVVKRWPLWRGVRYEEVSVMKKCPS